MNAATVVKLADLPKPQPFVLSDDERPHLPAPVEVTLSLITTPARATVIRLDTNSILGVTPLEQRLPRGKPLRLRFELAGHQPLERETSLLSDQALELTLRPVVIKQKPRPVTDGVLDPF